MASPQVEWKTWSMSHVYYPKGDLLGKLCAIYSLLPIFLMVAFFTLTVFVRDIHVILFFVGQFANELLNAILKEIVAESRPEQVLGQPNINDGYGWPSSHSQFQAFFFAYSTILIVYRLLKPARKPAIFCYFLIFINAASLAFMVFTRIYLRYHFLHQCLHGVAIGSVFAIFWFLLVNFILEPLIVNWIMMNSKLNNILELCSIYCGILEQSPVNSSTKKSKSK